MINSSDPIKCTFDTICMQSKYQFTEMQSVCTVYFALLGDTNSVTRQTRSLRVTLRENQTRRHIIQDTAQ